MAINQFPEISKFAAQKSFMRLSETNQDVYLSISVAKDGSEGKLWFLDTMNEELNSAVPELPAMALPVFLIEKITYEKQSIGSKLFNGYHVEEKKERAYAVIDRDESGEYSFLGWFSYDTTTRAPIGNKEGIPPKGVQDSDALNLIAGVVQRINANKPAWDMRKKEWDGKDSTYGLLVKQRAANAAELKIRKAKANASAPKAE